MPHGRNVGQASSRYYDVLKSIQDCLPTLETCGIRSTMGDLHSFRPIEQQVSPKMSEDIKCIRTRPSYTVSRILFNRPLSLPKKSLQIPGLSSFFCLALLGSKARNFPNRDTLIIRFKFVLLRLGYDGHHTRSSSCGMYPCPVTQL